MSSTLRSSSYSFDLLLVQMLMIISLIIIGSAMADDKPVVYLFGDSTFDVGTNNHLKTKARADFPYNGIDYPHSKPTGRFSNGYNTADQIVRLLGYQQSPPPFFALLENPSTFQRSLLLGVNFASGGSGILDSTGLKSVCEVVSMTQQVQQFATAQGNITQLLGPKATSQFLAKSLFFSSVGSNDIFDHYNYDRTTVSQQQLMTSIKSNFSNQLTNLYNLGARKFGIVSVPPIGCCPHARILNMTVSGSGCLTELNEYAIAYYSTIWGLLQGLNTELPGMIYSLGDAYNITLTAMKDPWAFGFRNTEAACCGKGPLNGNTTCYIGYDPNLCSDRGSYLFWDMYHPTQHTSKLAALTLFGGNKNLVTPINFSQLAQANST